jgi:hypothetical protein
MVCPELFGFGIAKIIGTQALGDAVGRCAGNRIAESIRRAFRKRASII